jgi:predicted acylesterase/phospholipase RssA
MTRRVRTKHVFTCILLLALPGCTYENKFLNDSKVPPDQRKQNDTRAALFTDRPPQDADGCFVGLSLSGGGSRSAAFSAACMFQLERVGILQNVDYISTVSGGSLPGAYYCLQGADWNPGTVQAKMTHEFATDLVVQTFYLPWNWCALLFGDYNRSDILAEAFNDVLYSRGGKSLTFADLRPDRPRLLINATNLQSGRRFIFCNESFNQINSDLTRYPISYAVAASSAVPVVLHPVKMHDYATIYPQYLQLVDGGVADNLGIVTLVDTYINQIELAQKEHLPDPYPHGAVFVVVDSRVKYNGEMANGGNAGWLDILKNALRLTSNSLLNRVSTATMSDLILKNAPDAMTAKELRDNEQRLESDGYLEMKDRTGHDIVVLYMSLSHVDTLRDVPFESFRQTVNSISTYFNIKPQESQELYQAADLLVKEKLQDHMRNLSMRLHPQAATRPAPSPTTREFQ